MGYFVKFTNTADGSYNAFDYARMAYHGASKVPLHSKQALADATNVDGHVVTDSKVWTASVDQFPLNTTAMKSSDNIVDATKDLVNVFTRSRCAGIEVTESDNGVDTYEIENKGVNEDGEEIVLSVTTITKSVLHNGFVWTNSDYPAVELYDAVEMSPIPKSNGAESPNGEFQSYQILGANGLRITDWVPVTAVIDPATGAPVVGYTGIAEAGSGSTWTVLQDSAKGDYGWALAKGNWEFVTMAGMLRFEPNYTPTGLGYAGVRYTGFKYIGSVLTETLEEVKSSVETNIQPKLTELEGKVAAEATARETADDGLQSQINTINDALETLGSVDGDGSIAGALATKVDKTDFNSKVSELIAADATKVDKVDGSSLVAVGEILKLSEYPDYETISRSISEKQTAAQVTAAIQAVIVDYYTSTQTDAKIAAAVASAFKYMGVVEDYDSLPTDLTDADTGKVYHVNTKGGKTVNSEYAWNGSAWEELGSVVDLSDYAKTADVTAAINAAIAQEVADRNAAIKVTDDKAVANAAAIAKEIEDREAAIAGVNAGNVALTGYTAGGNDVVTIEATDTINTAFSKVVDQLNNHDAVVNGAVSSLTVLEERVDDAESEIDVLQAATTGFDGNKTVAAAIADAKSAAEEVAATDASKKADAAESAAKSYTDEEITKAKTDIANAYGAADTQLGGRIDDLTGVVSSNKTEIESALTEVQATLAAADEQLRKDIAVNTSTIEGIEAGLSADIAREIEDRNDNDAAIRSQVDNLEGQFDDLRDALGDLGELEEGLVAAINDAKSSAITAAGAAADGKITAAIADEVSARQTADAELQTAIAAKADPIEVVIIGEGTDEAPQMLALNPGKWYIVKTPFVGSLPAAAIEGTYIKVSVVVGGDMRRVVAAEGETIGGSVNPCALGITAEGLAVNNESYYFTKIGTDWVIL